MSEPDQALRLEQPIGEIQGRVGTALATVSAVRRVTDGSTGVWRRHWQMLQSVSDSTSQKLRSHLVAGARVRVRGAVWRIQHVRPFDECTLVQLTGLDRDNAGQSSTLIDPFDCLQPEQCPGTLRIVRKRRWCHGLKELLALHHPFDGLRAAAFARVQLLPFQLEPALAVIRGSGCRLLLADDVGLGKTIQAGLLLAELRERGLADRALLLTPSGLRRQWQEELQTRFSIPATVFDSSLLRRRGSLLPAPTNPWLLDEVAIASIDLIKRAEALRGMASIVWDLLLVDEAHVASPATLRQSALRQLAERARRVVLISATPHAGDSNAFATLCSLGEGDGQPLLLFRRTRAQVGLPVRRRVRTLSLTLRPAERRLHSLLRAYAERVFREEAVERNARHGRGLLALAVLTKRALSSPASLRISVQRRMRLLSADEPPTVELQLILPWLEDEHDDRDLEPLALLGAPGLTDRDQELALLREIEAAAGAVAVGRKVEVLCRFLARISERALVFTEYRDTLQHVAATLDGAAGRVSIIHGGMDEAERIRAREAFTDGASRVLLATDAAGEGLNLQARCRLVINLELPWNPMRLEQRIGRVDRLGQERPVHAVNLLARGTPEEGVLGRLVTRLARARRAVGHVNDPLGPVSDDLTDAMLENEDASPDVPLEAISQPDLRAQAVDEALRLDEIRRVGVPLRSADQGTVPVTAIRKAQVGTIVRTTSFVCLMLARLVSGDGELIEHVLVPLAAPWSLPKAGNRTLHRPRTLRALVQGALERVGPELQARTLAIAQLRLTAINHVYQAAIEARGVRELALLRAIEMNPRLGVAIQPGLFDTRALRDHDAALRSHAVALDDETVRVKQIDRAHVLSIAGDPELALVLVVV